MTLDELTTLLDKNSFKKEEITEIVSIIKPIFLSYEFQKRLTNKYPHHGKITLGMHILEVMMKTYRISKKCNKNLSLKIAMMHDLYTYPWQNRKIKKSSFFHKHGFIHPIEAVLNASLWYKDDIKNISDASIIIDGIIHHMSHFPVVVTKSLDTNELELSNYDKVKYLKPEIKKIIISSLNRKKIGKLSFCKSKYKEGRVVRLADHLVSFGQITNFRDALALITGKNKNIK